VHAKPRQEKNVWVMRRASGGALQIQSPVGTVIKDGFPLCLRCHWIFNIRRVRVSLGFSSSHFVREVNGTFSVDD
jgi:hypothetical protein